VLNEQLGKRPRFNDDQRRCLAVKGKPVGRKNLLRLASIVTSDTLVLAVSQLFVSIRGIRG
jgi:hypothetical protein